MNSRKMKTVALASLLAFGSAGLAASATSAFAAPTPAPVASPSVQAPAVPKDTVKSVIKSLQKGQPPSNPDPDSLLNGEIINDSCYNCSDIVLNIASRRNGNVLGALQVLNHDDKEAYVGFEPSYRALYEVDEAGGFDENDANKGYEVTMWLETVKGSTITKSRKLTTAINDFTPDARLKGGYPVKFDKNTRVVVQTHIGRDTFTSYTPY